MNITKDVRFALTAGTATHVDEGSRCWWIRLEVGTLDGGIVLHATQITVALNFGGWLLDLAMGLPWEPASDAPHPVINGCRRVAWGFWSVTWGWVGPEREWA